MESAEKRSVSQLFRYFLYLGFTGFGGPLSLIQQMRQHFVERTKLIDAAKFDQAFTLVKAMPGPIAFQMAVFCGQHVYGRLAGFLYGLALIFPAFCMMLILGFGYSYFKNNIYLGKILNGFQFAVAAVLLWSLRNFFIQYANKIVFWVLLLLAALFYYFKIMPEPIIIIGFGILVVGFMRVSKGAMGFMMIIPFIDDPMKLAELFKVCAYAGAIVFGTGLALLPVLQNQFVVQYHWLDLQTFNDGVTFGQMTPGPVTITAAFLGFKIAGFAGALIATIGIFIMPLFHMLTWFPKVLGWLSKQKWINDFLLGATAAVVGVLLITIFQMNVLFISSARFWIIFLASLIYLLYRPKAQIVLVIFCGGLANLLIDFTTMNSI